MKHYSVVVVGSGPAGYTAAIYAARAGLNPIIYTGLEMGGQLTTTTEVENFPGFSKGIDGNKLMNEMMMQAENVGAKVVFDTIMSVDLSKKPYILNPDSNESITADSVIIASGASARWLGLDNEQIYRAGGVSACATCDGAFFKGKAVAVVGGGNTAVEEAIFLTNHASKVYLIHRRDEFRAEKIMMDRLVSNPKVEIITNMVVKNYIGDGKILNAVELENVLDNTKSKLSVDGLFVAIGHNPNTGFLSNQVKLDEDGYIITTPGTSHTNLSGVFAAGDVQDKRYRQAVTAAGSGCMAALDAQHYLIKLGK